jgi:pantoate kinase
MKKYNEILNELKKVAPGHSIFIKYTDADSDYENYDLVFEKLRSEGYKVKIDYTYPSGYLGYRATTNYTAEIKK